MGFIEAAVLGTIQGIAEWIPISSEGIIVLLGEHLFSGVTVTELIRLALYFHLGTFLAALVYFRKEVMRLLKQLVRYKKADEETKKLLNFYIIATLVSGAVGMSVLKLIEGLDAWLNFTTRGVLIGLGVMLMITGLVHLRRRGGGTRSMDDLKTADGVIAGVAQGISVVPGISRSGFTVASLLLRNINDAQSLKLSFMMSLPVVLAGNILLNTSEFIFTLPLFVGLVLSFGLGLLVIHFLLKAADKLPFGWFMLAFGLLVIVSSQI